MGEPNGQDFEAVARVIRAVGQPFRLAIVHCLRDGERCVCDIARAVGAERSNVSRHLAVLANAGVLTSRKQGLLVLYKLKTPCILSIFDCVGGVVRGDDQAASARSCSTAQPVGA
jgi:ArsR family transcriptional regulator